ncbi:P-loop containing nucleoside triphosphate hydrolase protein [Mycena floridula]|nr:P-loop containing nucleoside triphosphate hydrolase protein [Mycena floridula]
MHPHPNFPNSSRSEKIAESGRTAARILHDIANATKSSYLQGLAGVGSMIFETMGNVKSNKEKCLIMTEQAYELVCAVINCCEDAIELAPAFLHSLSVLTLTLQKVVSFLRNQTGGNLIKRVLNYQQNATLMEDCISSLQHALALFKVQTGVMTAARIVEMQAAATKRHTELMNIISVPNELDALYELRQSSSSVSVLLPPVPKIIHGRQDELNHITNALCQHDTARVAILGPGGIGKTSLAQAILHDPNIVTKYGDHRYWISCDSSESANDLIAVAATYFGLDNTSDRMHAILRCLRTMSRHIFLILDNLETSWEPPTKRLEVEEFLSHLTGVENLSLMITMRGAERPAQVQWTRPFLSPLGPIGTEAARQTFVEISDADEADPGLEELLPLMDNVPLVVSLMASVAEAEGCAMTLARWRNEGTSLLSEGVNRCNNLEKSIEVSLHSARLQSVPHAKDLLSILSYLPDGITSMDFSQTHFPFSNFSHCRSALCRISLAYITADDRLKLLAPIKEYIQKAYPPPLPTILTIRGYFFDLLKQASEIYKIPSLLRKFISNIGNIHFTIRIALAEPDPVAVKPILVLLLNLTNIYFVTQIGSFDLIESCSKIIHQIPDNSQLLGHYCIATYWKIPSQEVDHAEEICIEGIQHYKQANDMVGLGVLGLPTGLISL